MLDEEEYLDADLGCEALAACEVVARLRGYFGTRNASTGSLDEWVNTHPQEPPPALVQLAHRAVDRVTQTEQPTAGGQRLAAKVRRCRPQIVAFVGLGAYRTAFDRRHAGIGLQSEQIGLTRLWLLPNPSGLNANHGPAELAQLFGELKRFSDQVRD